MTFWMHGRRGIALALTALTMGSIMAAPLAARADEGDKGKQAKKAGKKGGDLPIVIGPATIVKDPQPNTPPPEPKKDKK